MICRGSGGDVNTHLRSKAGLPICWCQGRSGDTIVYLQIEPQGDYRVVQIVRHDSEKPAECEERIYKIVRYLVSLLYLETIGGWDAYDWTVWRRNWSSLGFDDQITFQNAWSAGTIVSKSTPYGAPFVSGRFPNERPEVWTEFEM